MKVDFEWRNHTGYYSGETAVMDAVPRKGDTVILGGIPRVVKEVVWYPKGMLGNTDSVVEVELES